MTLQSESQLWEEKENTLYAQHEASKAGRNSRQDMIPVPQASHVITGPVVTTDCTPAIGQALSILPHLVHTSPISFNKRTYSL